MTTNPEEPRPDPAVAPRGDPTPTAPADPDDPGAEPTPEII